MKSLALIITLLVCHYLADFCLTSHSMIRAKADGHWLACGKFRGFCPLAIAKSIR